MNLAKILALAGTLATAALAQTTQPAHFFLNMGYTGGGDTLAVVTFTNGSSTSVKAGNGVLLQAGLDYRIARSVAFQASIGYHRDSQGADNGSVTFTRVPIEALVFYYPVERFRMGLGLRKATGATLDSSGAASIGSVDFDSSTGTILEVEFLSRRSRIGQGGLNFRFINEKYTANGIQGAPTVDGSSIGVGLSWYF